MRRLPQRRGPLDGSGVAFVDDEQTGVRRADVDVADVGRARDVDASEP